MSWGVLVALLAGMALLFWMKSGSASSEDVKAYIDAGAVILDVRTPGEFSGGHVEGAVNIPVAELPSRLGELGEPGKVVVYCASGMRSAAAAKVLGGKGFDVINAGTARAFPS